jgi:hypothetical protein
MPNLELQSAPQGTVNSPIVVGRRSEAAPVFAVKQVPHVSALTDRGRSIPLFQFESLALRQNGGGMQVAASNWTQAMLDRGEQIFLRNTRQDSRNLVRMVEPRNECNCHGWIFAGGQFGIYGLHVPMILEDNGYAVVDQPQEGDVAIYYSQGMAGHSGLVRGYSASGARLIESKWGPFGVYLHPQDAHPFSGVCSFYRSSRAAHAMTIERNLA